MGYITVFCEKYHQYPQVWVQKNRLTADSEEHTPRGSSLHVPLKGASTRKYWTFNVKCQSFRRPLPASDGLAMAGQAKVKLKRINWHF